MSPLLRISKRHLRFPILMRSLRDRGCLRPLNSRYGLIGSTEWGEDHKAYLKSRVVAYLNVDMSERR